MSTQTFRALLAEGSLNKYTANFKQLEIESLPAGDILVGVAYSSLNYKDGLAVTGRGKIIHELPMVPGNDFVGTVVESSSSEFRSGDNVIGIGRGLGESRWGGYSQFVRVPASTLVKVPGGLSPIQCMAIGTAGFTSMLSLIALEKHGILPDERELLVTGAAGGVGSTSVALFSTRGFRVAASTGRLELASYLHGLGADSIVPRVELGQKLPPLVTQRWAGGVDTVGGQTLASFLAATVTYGAIAVTGLVSSAELPVTVFPFILRGVSLLGISCSLTPEPQRSQAWKRLAEEMPLGKLDTITCVEPLSEIKRLSDRILSGKIRGRIVLDVNK